jgi:hypothetical protein
VSSRISASVALSFVVIVYAFFASAGTFSFPCTGCESAPYASLADGFFERQLHLTIPPDPQLAKLYDPYNWQLRDATKVGYIWDASYYKGKYYLYFTPLPALIVYMPVKAVTKWLPNETLVALFFCVWALIMSVAFARRAVLRHGRPLAIPFPLWIVLIGFGNVITYLLADIRTYEIAIMCGMAMSATWAYSLLRFVEEPAVKRAAWMSVWLALSIAARPNVGLLLVIAALVVYRSVERAKLRRIVTAALIPLAVTALLLAAYNLARFADPLEFGVKYQLTYVPMRDHRVCSLCTPAEVARLLNGVMHYVFWAPTVSSSSFPFVELQYAKMDPALAFPGGAEQVGGAGAIVPLTLLASLVALILMPRLRELSAGLRTSVYILGSAWLILVGLSACWWFTSRYALDFMMLMAAATVVIIENTFVLLDEAGLPTRALKTVVVVLAVYSIVLSLLLGFAGWSGGFQRRNPGLYETIRSAFV